MEKVLLIDADSKEAKIFLGATVKHYKTYHAKRLRDAINILESEKIDIIFLDLFLEGVSSVELLEYFRQNFEYVPIIILSSFADETLFRQVSSENILSYIVKGDLNYKSLHRIIRYNLQKWAFMCERKSKLKQTLEAEQRKILGNLVLGLSRRQGDRHGAIRSAIRKVKGLTDDKMVNNYMDQVMDDLSKSDSDMDHLLSYAQTKKMEMENISLCQLVKDVFGKLDNLTHQDVEVNCHFENVDDVLVHGNGQFLRHIFMNLILKILEKKKSSFLIKVNIQKALDNEILAMGKGAPLMGEIPDYAKIQLQFHYEDELGKLFRKYEKEKTCDEELFLDEEGLEILETFGLLRQMDSDFKIENKEEEDHILLNIFLLIKEFGQDVEKEKLRIEDLKLVEEPAGEKKVKRILVAEDDPILREILCTTFEEFGFRTFEASNGRKAYDIYLQNPSAIDLAVIDGVMPEMDGIELTKKIFKINPQQFIIFNTGYSDYESLNVYRGLPNFIFLKKPYSIKELLAKIQDYRIENEA